MEEKVLMTVAYSLFGIVIATATVPISCVLSGLGISGTEGRNRCNRFSSTVIAAALASYGVGRLQAITGKYPKTTDETE